MSTQENQPSMEEMYLEAAKSQDYTILNKHLDEIRARLRDTTNKPSVEQIMSAYEFAKILREKTGTKDLNDAYIKANTSIELQNLKDEIQIRVDIENELKKMEWIKFNRQAYFNMESTESQKIVHFGLKRIDESNFIVEAYNEEVKITKNIKSIREVNVFISEIQGCGYDDLISRTKETGTSKKNIGTDSQQKEGISKKAEGLEGSNVVKDEKKEKALKRERGVNAYKEMKERVKESEIQLPKEESEALKRIFQVELKDTNVESAVKVLAKKGDNVLKEKEDWEKAGYEADGIFGSTEFAQLKAFQDKVSKSPEAKRALLEVFNYYLAGETTREMIKDRVILESYGANGIFEFLSKRKTSGSVNEQQVFRLLETGKDTQKKFEAICKLISVGGGEMYPAKSRQELYDRIFKNPSLKLAFLKGVDFIAGSRIDLGEYIKSGGNANVYLEKLEEMKSLGMQLDEKFEKTFPTALENAKKKIESDSKLSPEQKKETLEKLNNLENLEQRQKLKDFFKFKSLGLIGSLVESKEGGGMLMVIGNNSENSFLNKIDLEVGFFTTAGGTFLPGIGFAIGDTQNLTETVQTHERVGVNIYGAYILAGVNKQVNYNEIQEDSFNSFKGKTRRLGLYGNGAVGFFGGVTYGGGLYYKESKVEGIEQKRKQLENTIDLFKNIKSLEDIKNVKIPGIKEDKAELIRADIKNILNGIGFNEADAERKATLFDMMKVGKLNYFMQVASQIADIDGWNLSGLAIGVQFLSGFFPIPVAGFSVEKANRTESNDEVKKIQDNLVMLSKGEKSTDYASVAGRITREYDINTTFNPISSCFEIEGYDDKTGEITNLSGLKVRVMYSDAAMKEIKIDGKKIIIGNVGLVAMTDNLGKKGEQISLILGGKKNEMSENSENKFSNNSPKGYIEKGIENKQEMKKVDTETLTGFEGFIDKNVGKFNIDLGVAESAEWKIYKSFRKHLSAGQYEKARNDMIAYLKAHKKHLSSAGEGNSVGDIIKKLKGVDDRQQLALILANFKDALMSDLYTRGRAGKPHEKKKGEISNYTLATKEWQGIKGTNRKNAFEKMSRAEFGQNSEEINRLRKERVEEDKNLVGWNIDRESGKDVFALVASYKIAINSKTHKPVSGGKGFDAMPPGTVSVADAKFKEINGDDNKLFEKIFSQKEYKDHIKGVLARTIKANDNSFDVSKFSDENLKQMILDKKAGITINGVKYTLPEGKFVFFMYGRCYNEAIGLKFGRIVAEVPGKEAKYAPVNLMNNSAVESSVFGSEANTINIGIGGYGNEKKQPQAEGTTHQIINGGRVGGSGGAGGGSTGGGR